MKSINASKIINYDPLIFFHPVAKVLIICSLAATGAYFSHRTQLIRARGLFKMHPALLTYENVWPLEINDAYAAKAPHQSTANCYSVFIGNNNIRRAKDSYVRALDLSRCMQMSGAPLMRNTRVQTLECGGRVRLISSLAIWLKLHLARYAETA